jgi:hypothetical protein
MSLPITFLGYGYGRKIVSEIEEQIEQIKKQRKEKANNINDQLKVACKTNDHDKIKGYYFILLFSH